MTDGRLLLVHAHPDDESIATGATMAHYAALGAQVVLVTCTLGEQGEIRVPELAQLEAAQADQLGGYRMGELDRAAAALGVVDHRYLGGPGRFRDSGMAGTPANNHPRAFWRAERDVAVFDAAVAAAVAVLREVRPHVVVTYDEHGDYGHPDHVMAHRVTMAAVEAAADPRVGDGSAWSVPKVYWTATPRSVLVSDAAAVRARPELPFVAARVDALPNGVSDDVVTTVLDDESSYDAKRAALTAHRTQIAVHEDYFALTNLIGRPISTREHFRLVRGTAGPDRDADGHETDLFAGLW